MRMNDDEFLDKAALEAMGKLLACRLSQTPFFNDNDAIDVSKNAYGLASHMVNERKNRIAKSHGLQDE